MEKISWMAKKTDLEILEQVGESRRLVDIIVKRKKNWIGRVLRGEGLLREVMEGRMVGKRPRGRPRVGMLNELYDGSYGDMKRRAEDRERWRSWVPRTCR